MAAITGLAVRNFRSLRDITMGDISEGDNALSPLSVVIGKNGAGKSTLFDVFGFLADCLTFGVEDACYRNERGGYSKLHSSGEEGPIAIAVNFRLNEHENIKFYLKIGLGPNDIPFVLSESIVFWAAEVNDCVLLDIIQGCGEVMEPSESIRKIELDNTNHLAIATLGQFKAHPQIAAFRKYIESWYLSYFTPDSARDIPRVGPQKHLNRDGSNLGNVVQYLEQSHPDKMDKVLAQIADKIPGIERIVTEVSNDGRLLIQFHSQGFDKPFYAQQISDGTLKLFAYLLMLEDPEPAPLICIEEPENGLYHQLLQTLVEEFREVSSRTDKQVQLIITTHQPYLVDELDPEEVWVLEKQKDGFSTITRASDMPQIVAMVEQGIPLGSLWYSEHIDNI